MAPQRSGREFGSTHSNLTMPVSVTELLRIAVERGVVTRAQRESLQRLEEELDAGGAPLVTSAGGPRDDTRAPSPDARPETIPAEASRGFNAVSIAYWAGALLVVFAFGWFLAERWRALGASGVLLVAAVYVALFALVARTLGARGFRTASGFAWMLVVVMTPVWTWALLSLAGEWPDESSYYSMRWDNAWMASRWMILELATIGIGLLLLRRIRFGALSAPIAAALAFFSVHLGEFVIDQELRRWIMPQWSMLAAVALLALAYALDRRQQHDDDHAVWYYTAGLIVASIAWLSIWNLTSLGRHLLPVAAVGLLVASLYLRRRSLLIGGAAWGIVYLGYLAFDVFEKWLGFPVVLATFGIVVLVGTVWLQQRYPSLVSRVNRGADPRERPSLPYAVPIFAVCLLVAGVGVGVSAARAPERLREQHARQRYEIRNRPPPPVPAEERRAEPSQGPTAPSQAPERPPPR
jgi:hypothetical protein